MGCFSPRDGTGGQGELLVVGGTVLPLGGSGPLSGQAIVIVDSRIEAIGEAPSLTARYPNARTLDATGKIILPGLVNTHTHVPMTLFRGLADDLELMDWLENHIFPAEAEHVDEEFVRWGARLACLEMLSGGTTTFVDMYFYEDAMAEEVERCGMRAVLGQTFFDFPAPDNETWDEMMSAARHFLGRWRDHPLITPAVAPHAAYTVSGEHLKAAHALATELDAPLIIHVAESRGEIERVTKATGKTSVRYLDELGILDSRMLAAHMVWPDQEEIDLLAERGVGVAHCPQSNMKIAAGVAPVPALIEAGVAVGLGTDGTASNNDLNLWEEIDTAAKLHKVISGDPTVVDARTALRMATIEGARAIGLDDEIGSLEAGKRADLIIVNVDGYHQTPHYDPYSLLVYSTKASDVDTVIINGEIVVENGRVLTLDAREIMERAEKYRAAIAGGRTH